MMIWVYASIAVVFLASVPLLLRRMRREERVEDAPEGNYSQHDSDTSWLNLSQRIFDPSDARWLSGELGFPKLAESLTRARKQLAIHWLQTLQVSFDEIVRTPQPNTEKVPEADTAGSWKMLWLTVRLQFLLSYALIIVKLFGPYYRLVPSFSRIPFLQGSGSRFGRPAFVNNRSID